MDPKKAPPPFSSSRISRTASGGGGVILGRYQLGRLLGRGSFAKVFYARSLIDGKDVAVKIIDKPTAADAATETRIIREVSAMRRLDPHPNVLKLHEVMATKTKIYLVMELARGGELFAKLSRCGRLTEPAARRYFQQLVSALNFCHQNGVAHRDIKPQNLLLDESRNLKISDFGLSALFPEPPKNGLLHTACGTPAYTAPEVVSRKGYDGRTADAWSCGVILFVFLVGSLPFNDSNLPNMYRMMHRREFQFPDWISKSARSIIYRLLDPNPSTRLSIEALMTLPWFKKSLQAEENHRSMLVKDCNYMTKMNAFDIISMSSGLDLSGLFEGNLIKRERRLTSKATVGEIEVRVERVSEELGYKVERGKGGGIVLAKGRTVLLAEIWEVVPELLLVELRVVGGGGLEVEEMLWEDLKASLEDIVLSWHDDNGQR